MLKLKEFLVSKRMQSLYWRTGCSFVVASIAIFMDIMPTLGLETFTVMIIANVLGEVTKAINNFANGKVA